MKKPIKKKSPQKRVVKAAGKKSSAKKAPAKVRSSHAAGMHDAREVVQDRRFATRTLVSKMTFAAISFKLDNATFSPDLSGLLVDISAGGCSLVFMKVNPAAAKLAREVQCMIQIIPEMPRRATLRWIKDLDGRLVNAGFAFN